MSRRVLADPACAAVLDTAHLGDIEGALGTIHQGDTRHRGSWAARLSTWRRLSAPG